jgi:hypothetical protein
MEKSAKVTPKGEPRTPSGWHRRDEGRVCAECWKERYLLRAISIPVASPVDCSWSWPAMQSGGTFQMLAITTRDTHSAKVFHGSDSAN